MFIQYIVGYMEMKLRQDEWDEYTHLKVILMELDMNSMAQSECTEMIFGMSLFSGRLRAP